MGSDAAVADTRGAARPARIAPFACVLLAFASYLLVFGYRDELAENDLYRTLLGLLNGAATGRYLDDPLHYGRNFGFGYIELVYRLGDPARLVDRDAVVGLINGIGRVSAVVALACIMASLWMVHGERAALIGGVVFGFSPVVLDIAPSGHQLLPALAFFGAASVAMLADTSGWRRLVAYSTGAVLLFFGMTIRAELPLAFPWLVLAQRSPTTLGVFIRTALQRSVACLAAFGAFLALRHALFPVPEEGSGNLGSLGALVTTFFRLRNLGPGAVSLALGCGIATVVVASVALAVEAMGLRRRDGHLAPRMNRLDLLAPFSLVLIGILFWLPNPYPARHFTYVCLGLSVIIGVAAARRFRVGPAAAIGVGFAIVVANQVASEAARPLILSRFHSPYTNFPDVRRTLTAAPLGFFWRHSQAIRHRRAAFTDLGRKLGATCETRLLVLSDQAFHLATNLFRQGDKVAVEPTTVGPYAGLDISRPGRRAVYLPVAEGWPDDPLPMLLRAERLHDFKIAHDPYSRSIYDKTPIPEDRRADLDATSNAGACPPAPTG
jgi:hypothetical protein